PSVSTRWRPPFVSACKKTSTSSSRGAAGHSSDTLRRSPSAGSSGRSRRPTGLETMHVLLTGACGFIGSHVAEALLARGDTVWGLDNFNDFYDPAIKEGHRQMLEAIPGFTLVRG